MLSVGYNFPKKNILISSGQARSKLEMLNSARLVGEKWVQYFCNRGNPSVFFVKTKWNQTMLHWPDEEDEHPNTIEYLREKKIDLVVNIPKNYSKRELSKRLQNTS